MPSSPCLDMHQVHWVRDFGEVLHGFFLWDASYKATFSNGPLFVTHYVMRISSKKVKDKHYYVPFSKYIVLKWFFGCYVVHMTYHNYNYALYVAILNYHPEPFYHLNEGSIIGIVANIFVIGTLTCWGIYNESKASSLLQSIVLPTISLRILNPTCRGLVGSESVPLKICIGYTKTNDFDPWRISTFLQCPTRDDLMTIPSPMISKGYYSKSMTNYYKYYILWCWFVIM